MILSSLDMIISTLDMILSSLDMIIGPLNMILSTLTMPWELTRRARRCALLQHNTLQQSNRRCCNSVQPARRTCSRACRARSGVLDALHST